MFLIDLHCRVALATLFFTLALGLWGALNFARATGIDSSYIGAVVIGEVLVLLQGLLGLILVVTGNWPADTLHFLYGVVIALSFPGVYTYTHGEMRRREMGIYALVALFMFGLSIRAMMTGATALTCLPH